MLPLKVQQVLSGSLQSRLAAQSSMTTGYPLQPQGKVYSFTASAQLQRSDFVSVMPTSSSHYALATAGRAWRQVPHNPEAHPCAVWRPPCKRH